jgi:hypothetical protein
MIVPLNEFAPVTEVSRCLIRYNARTGDFSFKNGPAANSIG